VKLALFYEIPVARPWSPDSEYLAYQNTLEQVQLGDRVGFDSFWTVEHHFLDEFSHCSNPEVLYGAVAATTTNLRIGYGVRLMPKPYNHPVRTAESAAVLDLISGGRVDFGTGRSTTMLELGGFEIHPHETRDMWREALGHVIGCWTNDEYEFEGKYWSMPRRRVLPKPRQQPHPPVWGATGSEEGHRMMGQLGLGLCSFSVGTPPEELRRRIGIYREGIDSCVEPLGAFVNNQAAAFTMVHCAPTTEEACQVARRSFEWYPTMSAKLVATVAVWLEEKDERLGTYEYLRGAKEHARGLGDGPLVPLEHLRETNACVLGDPDAVIEAMRAYEATGCDLLLCLLNPYDIPHDKVMASIELIGKHVIPELNR
jgi:alkanesulfonate monooxygenase SsuD/methylene tetrahydromethanopterin reductase-like flavin-dependent oxidoreductase (luciferase family)